jgi:hypothetical protein
MAKRRDASRRLWTISNVFRGIHSELLKKSTKDSSTAIRRNIYLPSTDPEHCHCVKLLIAPKNDTLTIWSQH